jgi:outer membrane lipoprotein SlyB
MKRTLVLGILLSAISVPAFAGSIDGNAVLGGALGGAAGAAVGSAVGGRDGAIIGAGVGGAAGAAITTSDRRTERVREREVVYVDDDHHDNGRHLGHYKHKHRHGDDD